MRFGKSPSRSLEEPQQVRFGKSTGVFSHKRALSTRIRGSASNIKFRRREKGRRLSFFDFEVASAPNRRLAWH